MKQIFLAFIVFVFFVNDYKFYGQTTVLPEVQNLKTQFPDSKQVMLEKSEHLNIAYQAGEWDIWSKINEKTIYLSNQQRYAQQSVYLSGFDEITQLEAKTLVPVKKGKKTEYQEFPVEKIETKDVMMGNIFYSDYKEKKFSFPALQEGATTHLTYVQKTKEPHFLSAYYFSNYGTPVVSSVYSVSFPQNIEVSYVMLGENTDKIKFEKTQANGIFTYTWSANNIEQPLPEDNSPSRSYYAPHVVVYIGKLTTDNQEQRILGNTADLYKWYYSLIQHINQQPDENIIQLVNQLTATALTDTEKVRNIYLWVQQNIKYVAFEDGLGGFVPREASDVFAKKYGDCKDMSSILVKMLHAAGLPGYYTWIGSRDKPYSYKQVPTPVVDNHMIATTKLNGEWVFLDATGEYQPFGLPTSMIQGKEAMIGIDNNHFEIVVVPQAPPSYSAETENLTFTINNRSITGSGKIAYTGYKKVFANYDKLKADAAGKSNRFYIEYLRKGSNKFEPQNVQATSFKDNNLPQLTIHYDFTVPDYVTQTNNRLYVNLHLNQKYRQSAIDIKERKLDKTVEYQYTENFTYTLLIPDGYKVEYLPPAMQYADEEFGFTANYTQNQNSVSLNLNLYINHLLLKRNRFEEWNKFIDALNEAYQEVVVLVKDN